MAFILPTCPTAGGVPAAAESQSFTPKVVYPYHFRTGNVQLFKDALKGQPVDVRLGDWYPNGKGLGGR